MARGRSSGSGGRSGSARRYPREARLGETIRHVVAEELLQIDDERLALVAVTGVEVDREMTRGTVYFDSMRGVEGDAEILEAFAEHRRRLQSAIASQVQARRTPVLSFTPDEGIRSAERIDELLRADRERRTDVPGGTEE
jgi:ribosome-binding factor A